MNIKKLIAITTSACFLFSFVISQPLYAVVEQKKENGRGGPGRKKHYTDVPMDRKIDRVKSGDASDLFL